MRAARHESSEQIRERYLGEIAPLLAAARTVETLSPAERQQLRKRIVRTLFRSRSLPARLRLTPVLVGLGLLVAAGMAYATAHRLGLIRGSEKAASDSPAKTASAERHRAARPKRARQSEGASTGIAPSVESAAEQETVALPASPDPLPMANPPSSARVSAPTGEKPARVLAAPAPPAARRVPAEAREPVSATSRHAGSPGRKLALAAPYLVEPARAEGASPAPSFEGAGSLLGPPSPPLGADRPVASAASPAAMAVVPPPAPPMQQASPAPTPPVQLGPEPPERRLGRDSVMFGQALRKLRNEDSPAEALAVLQEHARAFPHSPLGGERGALQVEALLALHRDREALRKLDGMALDRLPRSGERFVVRGELRAAARRWQEAKADFERALAGVTGAPAWHQRALWGRGVARLRCGERESGLADIERYRELYPNGRFAAEASRLLSNP
jgi:hypothetical protein